MRPSGRAPEDLRPVQFVTRYTKHAAGSVLAEFGETRVLATASVESKVPHFLKGKSEGWITAEYGMLPRSTHTRNAREAARGKQSGRTMEIQRLIGRSLRSVTKLEELGVRAVSAKGDELARLQRFDHDGAIAVIVPTLLIEVDRNIAVQRVGVVDHSHHVQAFQMEQVIDPQIADVVIVAPIG